MCWSGLRLPKSGGMLSHLETLQLTFNRELAGPLPQSIGELRHLKRLYAWNTSLTSIPATIGNLTSLLALDLTDNSLEGSLPDELGQLS